MISTSTTTDAQPPAAAVNLSTTDARDGRRVTGMRGHLRGYRTLDENAAPPVHIRPHGLAQPLRLLTAVPVCARAICRCCSSSAARRRRWRRRPRWWCSRRRPQARKFSRASGAPYMHVCMLCVLHVWCSSCGRHAKGRPGVSARRVTDVTDVGYMT